MHLQMYAALLYKFVNLFFSILGSIVTYYVLSQVYNYGLCASEYVVERRCCLYMD